MIFGTGCDTAVQPGDADAAVSPSCLAARDHEDLAWIAEEVFAPSCALSSSCHTGIRPAGSLDLTGAARAHAQLVGVTAVAASDRVRVVPGDPAASYLLVKLGVNPGPLGPDGSRMPPNSPPLCAEKLAAVERWIAAGAPAAAPDAGPADASTDAPGEGPVDAGSTD